MNFPSQNNRTRTKLTWATIKPFADEWMLNLVWGIFPFIYMYLSVSLSWTYVNKSDVSASRNGANHENLIKALSIFLWTRSYKDLTTGAVHRWNLPQMKLIWYSCFSSKTGCWINMPCDKRWLWLTFWPGTHCMLHVCVGFLK